MVVRFLICFIAIALPLGCSAPQQSKTLTVDIHGQSFKLELILDQSSRMRGMMHRTSIPPNSGMLFIFPDTLKRSFWMKNCLVNIDLIFLDSRGIITTLYEMKIEEPRSPEESIWEYEGRLSHYWSRGPARFAIELSEGSIQELGLQLNDKIQLDLPYLKSLAR